MGTRELKAPERFGCPWRPANSVWTERNQAGESDARTYQQHNQASENPGQSCPSLPRFPFHTEVTHVGRWVSGYNSTNNVDDLEISYSFVTRAYLLQNQARYADGNTATKNNSKIQNPQHS